MLFVVSGEGDVDPNQATFTTPGLPATTHASHALAFPAPLSTWIAGVQAGDAALGFAVLVRKMWELV